MEWLTRYFVEQGLGWAVAAVLFIVIAVRERVHLAEIKELMSLVAEKDSQIRDLEQKRVDDIKNIHDVVLARVEAIQDKSNVAVDKLKDVANSTLTVVQTIQSVILRK